MNKKLTELKAELLRNGSETMRKLLDDNLFTERAFENIISEMLKQYGKVVVEEIDREKLAELEHEQWVKWSQQVAKTEVISKERLARWSKLWRPYAVLTEAEKDQDREYADKVIQSLKSQLDK